ncbi:MAG: UDP-2,4-diacetamido-2,4,6-trideoxy-beta-L-altropyranose hydrolase [Fusobacteriia bacterium 4572_132]|nr:MAG: UDP-2,4-diacetamido-2,4,6-trideoxy-beta-L-altropyranose hydrolase [Fusobacteriia bacterium 4572_132]
MKQSEILILTEGGRKIGYGHIIRCSALYDGLQKRGFDVKFIINGDDEVKKVLINKNYKIADWRNEKHLDSLFLENKIIIIDSYLVSQKIYDYISKESRLVVYVDDNKRLNYKNGIVINYGIYAKELEYEILKFKKLLGTTYSILREPFLECRVKNIKKEINNILITLGGSDVLNLTPKILKILNKKYENIKKDVIVGNGFNNIEEIQLIKDDKIKLFYNLNAQEMKEKMGKADLVISTGGSTLYELIAVGVPTIAIRVAENQKRNIEYFKKEGIIIGMNDFEKKILLEKIEEIKNIEIRKKMSKKGQEKIDGFGVKRIVDVIEKNNFSLRRATIKDIKKVYELSNANYVREYSTNKEKIKWNDHIIWYNDVLENQKKILYIVEVKGEFVGQVRFDLSEIENVISISLSEKIRGKGMGKWIIDRALMRLEKEERIKKVTAYILEDNVVSKKVFENFDGEVDIQIIKKCHELH